MNRDLEDLADFYAHEHSDLWRKVYPRVYQSIGEYQSPRFVALNLVGAILWLDTDRAAAPLSASHVATLASRAFDFDLPAFFVSREFLAAICQTDLPDDIKWTDTKLPYDAGLLYLPLGALRDPEGAAVNVLGWHRLRKGEQILVGRKMKIDCIEDAFIVLGLCEPSVTRMYSRCVDASQTHYIAAPTVTASTRGIFDLPLTKDDEVFLSQMVSICFSILLSLNAKPELLTPGQLSTGKGKKTKKAKREFWTPNIIGRSYRVQREHRGGSHASPRLHWRRGRWNHQPIGNYRGNPDFVSAATLPRLADGRIDWDAVSDDVRERFWKYHKHIWLEPVLIEGEGD